MTQRKDNEVAIVGGGVGGISAALALGKRGIGSTVFEKVTSRGKIDRGDVIHQSSYELLAGLGAEPFLEARDPVRFTKFAILDNSGECIFSTELDKDVRPGSVFTAIRHPQIVEALEEAALETGLVRVNRGDPCIDLRFQGQRVVGVDTRSGSYSADLTIIANGAMSALRDRYFGKPKFHEYPVHSLNTTCRLIPRFSEAGYYVVGKKGVLIMVPLPNDLMRIGIQMRPEGQKIQYDADTLRNMIIERLSNFPVDEFELNSCHDYLIRKSLAAEWHRPGAVLLGDSAHTTHPVGGQGMNLALQDADLLARALAEQGPRSEARIDHACEHYARARRRQVSKVLRRSLARGVIGETDNATAIMMRELFLKFANRSKLIKKMVFDKVIDVK